MHRRRRYRRRLRLPGAADGDRAAGAKPIAKGRFTAGFLARLLFEKYVLGLPVHRIAQALAAEGLDVAEGTLAGALKAVRGPAGPAGGRDQRP